MKFSAEEFGPAAVVTLTDAVVIAVDLSPVLIRGVVLGGNRTLGVPSLVRL